ncbi:hypothetical protein B0H34DRAFT_680855 [Crassisporium funariophilum]|nr:hypothetical protein B0H34DRAFT_680855 [Crassisporium funariophilum]
MTCLLTAFTAWHASLRILGSSVYSCKPRCSTDIPRCLGSLLLSLISSSSKEAIAQKCFLCLPSPPSNLPHVAEVNGST